MTYLTQEKCVELLREAERDAALAHLLRSNAKTAREVRSADAFIRGCERRLRRWQNRIATAERAWVHELLARPCSRTLRGGAMSLTVDCGEGKHNLCSGRGRTAYLFPQESVGSDEPSFYCGCGCHHGGTGVPCTDPRCPEPSEGEK